MSNVLARSAIFTASPATLEREMCHNKKIASMEGTQIFFSGQELRQDGDLDVFLQITHLAREQPLGAKVEFTGYGLLKALGWRTSKKDYERLKTIIDRLKAGTTKVAFEDGKRGFSGSLIRKFAWRDEDDTEEGSDMKRSKWIVFLEPEILALFGENDYTRLDIEQRQRLRYDMSKWLHTYYHTHDVPFAHSVKWLHERCGSKCKTLAHFRPVLKRGLEELKEEGFFLAWRIDDKDLVHVERAPKRPQLAAF
ncbi:Plasmid replication initiator protein TrfA [compost metagenome]